MRYDWFKQFSINQFESVLRFTQISIRVRITIWFGNWFFYSYVTYVNDTHEISFCSANFFRFFFKGFTLRVSPFTETKRTLCTYLCYEKYDIQRAVEIGLLSRVIRYFGSYCSYHTRRKKFNSFPATNNILLYFVCNLLYLIEVFKRFLGGI